MISHAAWAYNRFARDVNGQTPYQKAMGQVYRGVVLPFGSLVMLKVEKPATTRHRSKMRSQWVRGVWLGKVDKDDSHIVATSEGVKVGRTVRAIPNKPNQEELLNMIGVPWNLDDGLVAREEEQPHPEALNPSSDDESTSTSSSKSETADEVPVVVDMPQRERLPRAEAERERSEVIAEAQERAREYALREQGMTQRKRSSSDVADTPAAQLPRLAEQRGEKRSEPERLDEPSTPPPTAWRRIGHERYSPEREHGIAASSQDAATATTTARADIPILPALMLCREVGVYNDEQVCQLTYEAPLETLDYTYGEELQQVEALHEGEVAFPEHSEVIAEVDMNELTPEETRKARLEELDKLSEFQALRPFKTSEAESIKDGLWLTSRWVDSKRKGAPRSRWVLREFANTAADSEYYAATPDNTMIEILHVHALRHGLDLVYLDVSRAFLHAPEEKYVFIKPPEEAFADDCPKELRCQSDEVWIGLRKLNGRRDGPQSFGRYSSIGFGAAGFRQSKLHPSFYVSKDGMLTSVGAHVDDWVLAVRADQKEATIERLRAEFWVKVEGELPASSTEKDWQVFLGHERARIGMRLYRRPQQKYLATAAKLMGLDVETSKGAATPITPESMRLKDETQEVSAEEKKLLQAVVGCLIYVRDSFRLAQFAIHHVSRELQKPTSNTVNKVKRLVRYLISIQHQEVVMDPSGYHGCQVQVFSDSDWAGDLSTRKSVDCVVARYFGCVVHMSTKQQSFIAQSSAEAELSGCHRAAVMAMSILNFIMEMWSENFKAEIFTDSKAGLAVTQRSGVGGIRHLQVKQLWCQEVAARGRVVFKKIKGTSNPADAGTKAHRVLEHFVEPLGIEVPEKEYEEKEWVADQPVNAIRRHAGVKSILGLLASCMMQVARASPTSAACESNQYFMGAACEFKKYFMSSLGSESSQYFMSALVCESSQYFKVVLVCATIVWWSLPLLGMTMRHFAGKSECESMGVQTEFRQNQSEVNGIAGESSNQSE
eukprot:6490554-Amphidinium_carterae.1